MAGDRVYFNSKYGLCVVAVKSGNIINAQIANTAFNVETKPWSIAISIWKTNYTHELIEKSGKFSISLLSSNTPIDFIESLGFRTGRKVDKIKGLNCKVSKNDIPVISDNAVAVLECEVEDSMSLMSHTVFVAKVIDADVVGKGELMTEQMYKEKKGKFPKDAPITNSF